MNGWEKYENNNTGHGVNLKRYRRASFVKSKKKKRLKQQLK